jgi:hypothetical protein
MTGPPWQRIGLCVSDSQIQVVFLDGGIDRQNSIPRDACLNGRSQVTDQDPCAPDDWHAAQDFRIRDDRVVSL